VPARVAEAEDLHTLREELDLMRRTEHDTHVPVADSRQRMRPVRRRTWHVEAGCRIALADVDHVEDESRTIQQVHRLDAVRQSVERLDAGQRVREAERLIVRHRRGGAGLLLVQDQHS
jgi:hypothetical protein